MDQFLADLDVKPRIRVFEDDVLLGISEGFAV